MYIGWAERFLRQHLLHNPNVWGGHEDVLILFEDTAVGMAPRNNRALAASVPRLKAVLPAQAQNPFAAPLHPHQQSGLRQA